MTDITRMVLGGDVMLGRLVKNEILTRGIDYPLGKISHLLKRGDLTLVNLECAITDTSQRWSGPPKAFYFGAPSSAVQSLVEAGVDAVTLANNHALDFDYQGLLDTFNYLKNHHIQYAGAGINENEATQSIVMECGSIRVGLIAYCDHQEDFKARHNQPGIAYIDLENKHEALLRIENSLYDMQKQNVEWPILSLHWGPNKAHRPSSYFMEFAHAAIDKGYKMIFGHSAHVFQGIEIYKNCPIIYSAGDLVDDYYVGPDLKNDHQLLFELELSGTQLVRIRLYPVFIESCSVRPAVGDEFDFIAKRATQLCSEMGTQVQRHVDYLSITG